MKFTSNALDIAKQINRYKEDLLAKVQCFLTELADVGVITADVFVGQAKAWDNAIPVGSKAEGAETKHLNVNRPTRTGISVLKSKYGARYRVVIKMTGPDVLFVEFSTGITYGTAPGAFPSLPTGKRYGDGYGYGTYSFKTDYYGILNAYSDDGWYFRDENGVAYKSKGNKAFAPMYHADDEMCRSIGRVATRVFGSYR